MMIVATQVDILFDKDGHGVEESLCLAVGAELDL